MLNAELKILGGKYQGKTIPLASKRFLVGREQDCQLRPNSELVSRHHCVFIVDDYAVRLRDLGSTNGTRVNGDLVRGEIVLNPGDRVTIGRLELEVVVRQPEEVASKVAVAAPVAAAMPPSVATVETPPVEIPV
jgi:pSer/pThr/pTyr-binding forkhead associated (FHA) protein